MFSCALGRDRDNNMFCAFFHFSAVQCFSIFEHTYCEIRERVKRTGKFIKTRVFFFSGAQRSNLSAEGRKSSPLTWSALKCTPFFSLLLTCHALEQDGVQFVFAVDLTTTTPVLLGFPCSSISVLQRERVLLYSIPTGWPCE